MLPHTKRTAPLQIAKKPRAQLPQCPGKDFKMKESPLSCRCLHVNLKYVENWPYGYLAFMENSLYTIPKFSFIIIASPSFQ